jgi:hypothetical protein
MVFILQKYEIFHHNVKNSTKNYITMEKFMVFEPFLLQIDLIESLLGTSEFAQT